jgi:steroid delta-isomerase
MTDPNFVRKLYDRYPELVTKGDVDAIVDLYAEDATIEDPIGSELRAGRDAIRAFYQAAAGTITMKRTGPVRVAGDEAATPLVVLIGPEGQQQALDVISVMTFDKESKIQTMRAYWSFDALRPATDDD